MFTGQDNRRLRDNKDDDTTNRAVIQYIKQIKSKEASKKAAKMGINTD
jgi:hypothetical protein